MVKGEVSDGLTSLCGDGFGPGGMGCNVVSFPKKEQYPTQDDHVQYTTLDKSRNSHVRAAPVTCVSRGRRSRIKTMRK